MIQEQEYPIYFHAQTPSKAKRDESQSHFIIGNGLPVHQGRVAVPSYFRQARKLSDAICGQFGSERGSVAFVSRISNERNYVLALTRFFHKWGQKPEAFNRLDDQHVLSHLRHLFSELACVGATDMNFELTEDLSVFISAKLDSYTCYLELFFDADLIEAPELIANIYNPDGTVQAFGGNPTSVIASVRGVRTKDQSIWDMSTPQIYEVSGGLTTETPVWDY